jgi:hypothetical protein
MVRIDGAGLPQSGGRAELGCGGATPIISRRAMRKSQPDNDSGADYGIVSNMYGVVTSACVPFL